MNDYLVILAAGVVTVWAVVKMLALVPDPDPRPRPVAIPIRVVDQALDELGGRP